MWGARRLEGGEFKYGRKKELSKKIELGWGFGELRGQLGNFEDGKIWKSNEEAKR